MLAVGEMPLVEYVRRFGRAEAGARAGPAAERSVGRAKKHAELAGGSATGTWYRTPGDCWKQPLCRQSLHTTAPSRRPRVVFRDSSRGVRT